MGDSILCKTCLSPAMDGAGTRRLENDRWRLRLMKKFLLGTVALVALGAAAPAMAADLAARPYTWGPALLYAKGGYAWKDGNNLNVTTGGVPVAFTTNGNHRDGYTVGAGLEYMFAPSWSAKVEYQYYNFGSTTFTTGPAVIVGTRFRDDEHTVKAGINYRFNWGGPVVAKY